MVRSLICVVLGLALLAPAAASAGTASTDQYGNAYYRASPGESNRITASGTGPQVVFHDDGAAVEVDGCTSEDAHTARCEGSFAEVRAGDGDDVVRLVASHGYGGVAAYGGSGDDELVGGNDNAFFVGGDDDDVIRGTVWGDVIVGGEGRDVIRAGGGDDRVRGDDPRSLATSDVIHGGHGDDTISYEGRAARVTVDLRRRFGGEAGEADALFGFENIQGGHGPDRLIGDAGPNRLRSGGHVPGQGPDVVRGGGGDDTLTGARQSDALAGGAGDDKIVGHGGPDHLLAGSGNDVVDLRHFSVTRSSFQCGRGGDRVLGGPPHVLIPSACERIEAGWFLLWRRTRLDREGELRLRIDQPYPGLVAWCRAIVELRGTSRALLGKTVHRVPVEHPTWVRVPLNARGREAVLGHRRISIRVGGDYHCSGPASGTTDSGFEVRL